MKVYHGGYGAVEMPQILKNSFGFWQNLNTQHTKFAFVIKKH